MPYWLGFVVAKWCKRSKSLLVSALALGKRRKQEEKAIENSLVTKYRNKGSFLKLLKKEPEGKHYQTSHVYRITIKLNNEKDMNVGPTEEGVIALKDVHHMAVKPV